MEFSVEQLARATGATEAHAAQFHPHLIEPMQRFGIDENANRMAAFFASIGVESNHLTAVEENLNYRDPERLARLYLRIFDKDHDRHIEPAEVEAARPYCHNPKGLSELLYQGYHGRSLLQLTWQDNYQRAADALGYDYVSDPNLLLEPEHAALVACWFFSDAGCLVPADACDMRGVTRLVNGPSMQALPERQTLFNSAEEALAVHTALFETGQEVLA